MKAKVIATGEIVEVSLVKNTKSTYVDSNGHFYPDTKLEIIPDIDWEQRRFELVKAAVQGLSSIEEHGGLPVYDIANISIDIADAVIVKLKEEKK